MKKTISIKTKAIRSFLIITVVVGILVSLTVQVMLHLYADYTFAQNADSHAMLIKDRILADVDVTTLLPGQNNPEYDRISSDFEEFCTVFNIQYIFLYTYTDDKMIMRNLIATASEEGKALIEKNDLVGKRFAPTKRGEDIIQGRTTQTSWEERNEYGNVRSYMYGLYDDTGKLIGFICMDVLESEIQNFVHKGAALAVVLIAFILLSVFFLVYRSLNRNVFKPLNNIASSMRHYIDDYGKEGTEIHLPPNTEMQSIVHSFDIMSDDIQQYIDNIELLTEERAKTEASMETARRIQTGFVPSVSKHCFAGAGMYAIESPSKAVGGDFYDCFEKDGKLYGVVGDVSEKGISAALFMVVLKSKISDFLRTGMSPAEALLTVNDELCNQNPEGMFATVFTFMLNLHSGAMTFANAGHNRPVLLSGKASLLDIDSGMLIGLMKDIPLKDETLTLAPGDAVVLYTDGVTEALNKNREFYGEKRLLALLNSTDTADAQSLTEAVKQSVDRFQEGCEPFDDITVFSLQYYGDAVLTLPCNIDAITEIRTAVFDRLGKNETSRKILLACEEIFTNICSYSHADYVKVTLSDDDVYFVITIQDNGIPFNPLQYNKQKEFSELAGGGMGITLVKQIADKTAYASHNGENVFKMYFKTD